jgi:hypothetical protein
MSISYLEAKQNQKAFLSATSLHVDEFDALCIVFKVEYEKVFGLNSLDSSKPGRPRILSTIQDNLFFILFYAKNYALQEVMGLIFGIKQSRANELIHELSPILKSSLDKLGCIPERNGPELEKYLQNEEQKDLLIDATEREIQRPSDNELQEFYYSGKAGCHTVKNIIVGGLNDRRIKYLGETVEGKKHDKKAADEDLITFPDGTNLHDDTGFLGYEPSNVNVVQPEKKPKGGSLTDEQKKENRLISSVRVVIEHIISGVKRLHIVKDVFRNKKEGFNDLVMEIACGLHNFRCDCRMMSY